MSRARYTLDACAVIAFLIGEAGADKVKDILVEAATGETKVYIHRINLLEVYYDAYKSGGRARANTIYLKLLALPITQDTRVSDEIFFKAGELKATNKISLADAFALALAIDKNATLVTSDHHEFDVIERAGLVAFEWIR